MLRAIANLDHLKEGEILSVYQLSLVGKYVEMGIHPCFETDSKCLFLALIKGKLQLYKENANRYTKYLQTQLFNSLCKVLSEWKRHHNICTKTDSIEMQWNIILVPKPSTKYYTLRSLGYSDHLVFTSLQRPTSYLDHLVITSLQRPTCYSDPLVFTSLQRPTCYSDHLVFTSLRRPTRYSDHLVFTSLRRPTRY